MLLRFSTSQKYQSYFISSEKRQSGDRLSEGDLLQAEGPQEEVEGLVHYQLILKIMYFHHPGVICG